MATTNKKTTPSWPYDKEFKQSNETTAAEQWVKELESNAPGAFTYDTYEKSDIAKQADAAVEQHKANKPGKMEYSKQAGLDDIWNQIMNREDFSYDLNGDALYQQYKDQYVLQGQQAMMDTMGQAQAMTGGYGNSYAQSVGQQTYQGYLQQLNDKVPELYQLALSKYNQEGQDLYNKYSMHSDMYDKEYKTHRDSVSDYYTELQYLTDNARYMSEDDYNKYWNDLQMKYGIHRNDVSDYYTNLGLANDKYWNLYNRDYGQYTDNRDFSYGQYRNQVADDQWQQEYDSTAQSKASENLVSLITSTGYEPTDAELKAAGMTRAQANAYKTYYTKQNANTSGSGSGTKTGTKTGTGYDNGEYSPDIVELAQNFVGISVDGKWGNNSSAKAKEKGYNSLAEVVAAMNGENNGNLDPETIKNIQWSLGVDRTGVWDAATIAASGFQNAADGYSAWNQGKVGTSKNAIMAAGNKLNADMKGKDDSTKERMIKSAYEAGTIDAEMAGELLRVNGLL